jgi:hypothetical protein
VKFSKESVRSSRGLIICERSREKGWTEKRKRRFPARRLCGVTALHHVKHHAFSRRQLKPGTKRVVLAVHYHPKDKQSHCIMSKELGVEKHKLSCLDEIAVESEPPYTVFSNRDKLVITIIIGIGMFFSPFTANVYFPALSAIQASLHTTPQMINLTMTIYIIFQGLTPTFFGGSKLLIATE